MLKVMYDIIKSMVQRWPGMTMLFIVLILLAIPGLGATYLFNAESKFATALTDLTKAVNDLRQTMVTRSELPAMIKAESPYSLDKEALAVRMVTLERNQEKMTEALDKISTNLTAVATSLARLEGSQAKQK